MAATSPPTTPRLAVAPSKQDFSEEVDMIVELAGLLFKLERLSGQLESGHAVTIGGRQYTKQMVGNMATSLKNRLKKLKTMYRLATQKKKHGEAKRHVSRGAGLTGMMVINDNLLKFFEDANKQNKFGTDISGLAMFNPPNRGLTTPTIVGTLLEIYVALNNLSQPGGMIAADPLMKTDLRAEFNTITQKTREHIAQHKDWKEGQPKPGKRPVKGDDPNKFKEADIVRVFNPDRFIRGHLKSIPWAAQLPYDRVPAGLKKYMKNERNDADKALLKQYSANINEIKDRNSRAMETAKKEYNKTHTNVEQKQADPFANHLPPQEEIDYLAQAAKVPGGAGSDVLNLQANMDAQQAQVSQVLAPITEQKKEQRNAEKKA